MSDIDHVLDPEGDVIIVLHNPNPPFAVSDWETPADSDKENECQHCTEHGEAELDAAASPENATSITEDESDSEPALEPVRFQVSSKHLTLASPVFHNMLNNGWKEGMELRENGTTEINTEGWDEEAFLLVLMIIHAKTDGVPLDRSPEQLAQIAVVVDYYDVQNMTYFVHVWVVSISKDANGFANDRDFMLQFWIVYVFGTDVGFTRAVQLYSLQRWGPVDFYGLPFNPLLRHDLENIRTQGIEYILDTLQEFHDSYRNYDTSVHQDNQGNELVPATADAPAEERRCCFCRAMLLAVLTKVMRDLNLYAPRPSPPYYGISIQFTFNGLKYLLAPQWSGHHSGRDGMAAAFESLRNRIYAAVIGPIEDAELKLSDYRK
ncbi:hypothetical protein BDV18DRAFT_163867 [Aspergillus unguis]